MTATKNTIGVTYSANDIKNNKAYGVVTVGPAPSGMGAGATAWSSTITNPITTASITAGSITTSPTGHVNTSGTFNTTMNTTPVTVTATTGPSTYIQIGDTKLTEKKLEKLTALLDMIEGMKKSEVKALFDTIVALNRIKK